MSGAGAILKAGRGSRLKDRYFMSGKGKNETPTSSEKMAVVRKSIGLIVGVDVTLKDLIH